MRLFTRGLIFLILMQFSSVLVIASNKPNGNSQTLGWKLVTESFGITVYERWIELDTKVKVRERSGKMIVHSSMDEVIELISDLSRVHLWMNNVEKVELLKSVNRNEWYQRIVLDAPWPFSKQDIVSKYIVYRDPSTDKAKIEILRETKLYPKQDGFERLDSFNARWDIEQISSNKVKVTFTTLSTKPPKYPCWVQDPVIRNVFFSNLKNFKKLISNV